MVDQGFLLPVEPTGEELVEMAIFVERPQGGVAGARKCPGLLGNSLQDRFERQVADQAETRRVESLQCSILLEDLLLLSFEPAEHPDRENQDAEHHEWCAHQVREWTRYP